MSVVVIYSMVAVRKEVDIVVLDIVQVEFIQEPKQVL